MALVRTNSQFLYTFTALNKSMLIERKLRHPFQMNLTLMSCSTPLL